MVQNRPCLFSGNLLKKGVVVRHLVLPGKLESTRKTLAWFRENLYGQALLSLMSQYTPIIHRFPEQLLHPSSYPISPSNNQLPCRRISRKEHEQVLLWLDELGIEKGFVQDYEIDESWLPDFQH